MAEDQKDAPAKSSENLDLASLSGLDFGPDWADESKSNRSSGKPGGKGGAKGGGKRGSEGRGPNGPQRGGTRDRRGEARKDTGGSKSRSAQFGRGRERRPQRTDFEPTVKVDLYPQDEAFDALLKRLRASARTYQLFDIAQLLLEKSERFVVVVTPKQKKDAQETGPLYYSVPGHLPFQTESEAIHYVLNNHLDLFFETEEYEAEPPTGNFQMVHRCGITGELLGPPNYHRYQEFVKRHFASRISGMSLERFQAKIESTKEQEDIDAWLESMRKRVRYILKDRADEEPESFDTFESARQFLILHRKDKMLGTSESVRFAGRDLERMPRNDIRRSVENYVEQQRQFPLDTANNIRGRLRRHNFAVYKKGSKGASFVCAVKRKFRDENTAFTESISQLIDFIEKHPNTPASKLPKLYIGIDTEKQQPEALKMTDEQVKQAEKARKKAQAEATASEEPSQSEETADAATAADPAAQEKDPAARAEDTATDLQDPASGEKDKAPSTATTDQPAVTSTDAQPKSSLSEEEQAKLRQLMLDLRWLITEGYVTEYGDGKLFAPPPLPTAKKENGKKAVAKKSKDAKPETLEPETEEPKKSDDSTQDQADPVAQPREKDPTEQNDESKKTNPDPDAE